MAQRRAKQQQEEQQHRQQQEERKAHEQEEKRQRRKSQMEALKAAMHEIKVAEPPVSSPSPGSSKKLLFRGEGTGGVQGKVSSSLPSAPIQILTRKSGNKKNDGGDSGIGAGNCDGDRRKTAGNNLSYNFTIGPKNTEEAEVPSNETAPQKSPKVDSRPSPKIVPSAHTYSVTIGPPKEEKPKGELQPNGTVKFSRKSSLRDNIEKSEKTSVDKATGEIPGAALGVGEGNVDQKVEGENAMNDRDGRESSSPMAQAHTIQSQSGVVGHDDDETSMTSGGSRRSSYSSKGRGGRGRRNSKGGRGGRNRNNSHTRGDHSKNDDSSVTSNRSQRSGRGGGGGGRRRNSLPKHVGGEERSRGGAGRGRGRSGRGRGRDRDDGGGDTGRGSAGRSGGSDSGNRNKGANRNSGRGGGNGPGRGGGRKGRGRNNNRGGNRGGGSGGGPAKGVQHSYEIGK